jgi:hypothetical protein
MLYRDMMLTRESCSQILSHLLIGVAALLL